MADEPSPMQAINKLLLSTCRPGSVNALPPASTSSAGTFSGGAGGGILIQASKLILLSDSQIQATSGNITLRGRGIISGLGEPWVKTRYQPENPSASEPFRFHQHGEHLVYLKNDQATGHRLIRSQLTGSDLSERN